jgi:hypothetical protein
MAKTPPMKMTPKPSNSGTTKKVTTFNVKGEVLSGKLSKSKGKK